MAWKQPVFNKTKESFMNVVDIKRVIGNIEYIHIALRAGASVPTPPAVTAKIQQLLLLDKTGIVYKEDFDWIREQVVYLVEKYNLYGPNTIVAPTFTQVDYLYMNAIELMMFQYKINLLAGWGF